MTRDSKFGKRRFIPVGETSEKRFGVKETHEARLNRSYRDVLEGKGNIQNYRQFVQKQDKVLKSDMRERLQKSNCIPVCVHNLFPLATRRDIWLFLNKDRLIKDIILLRKRVKNNNMIRFLIMQSKKHAEMIIAKILGMLFKGKKNYF